MDEDLNDTFVDLIKGVLTPGVDEAVKNGTVEVYIGFQEIVTEQYYSEPTIRPYVNIRQVKN